MTNAAKAFGKQLQHFWNSPDTHQYLQARAESMGKSSGFDDLYETHRGYHGGTWARPKLAVFFARCSPFRAQRWLNATGVAEFAPCHLPASARADSNPCNLGSLTV
jgi:hypothetical protein